MNAIRMNGSLAVACSVTLLLCLTASAQPVSRGMNDAEAAACDLRAMPRLPADALIRPARRIEGRVWLAGHFRCNRGRWEYLRGRWITPRRGGTIPWSAAIEVLEGRIRARPGFRFVQNGPTGPTSIVPTAQMGQSLGGLGVRGDFLCTCAGGAGQCKVRTVVGTMDCTPDQEATTPCSGTCVFSIIIRSDFEMRTQAFLERPCQERHART